LSVAFEIQTPVSVAFLGEAIGWGFSGQRASGRDDGGDNIAAAGDASE
jgi:hypothetical protein